MLDEIKRAVREYKDFPKPGIIFKDISPVFQTPIYMRFLLSCMHQHLPERVTHLVSVESRGFLFAAPLSVEESIPHVLVRKKGKLPGQVFSYSYLCEYAVNDIEIQRSSLPKGSRVLVVDDILATGATFVAVNNMVTALGSEVVANFAVFDLVNVPRCNEFKVLVERNIVPITWVKLD